MAGSTVARRRHSRIVVQLDRGWRLLSLPGFRRWPAEAQLTSAQLQALHCPWPRGRWRRVHLPDDYIVRGGIAPHANPALRLAARLCAPGGRECLISSPAPARMNTRLKRSAFGGHGYLPVYPAWYYRRFFLPGSYRGKTLWLNFGGVYRDAVVFVNGHLLSQHPSGYTAFRLNISRYARFERYNSLAVFVDPRWFEGWWYEGGGIYRHVRLIVTDKLHVAAWGSFVISRVISPIRYGEPGGYRATARLTVQNTLRNRHGGIRRFILVSRILSPAGKVMASIASRESLPAGGQQTFSQRVLLKNARLWSLQNRNLYRLETILRNGGHGVDRKLTTFGIRTIAFDPKRGFFLDGRHVELRGAANHQDFPGVGIGAPDNLWAWRIAKLKAMGANAYRCAHNPVAEAFYRACDRMGMLVMDENRHFGDTYAPKSSSSTPYRRLTDLKAMVLQHRNHPAIIMWSMFNEEGVQKSAYGAKMAAAMLAAVKKLDPTRPITSAVNGGYSKTGVLSVENLLGMNYHAAAYARLHREFPRLPIFASEAVNAKSSRGGLHSSAANGRCSQYGCKLGKKRLGPEPWQSWIPVAAHRFVAGEFMWTGFDYRGEPNPFSWPAVTSQTGAMDLCGFRKPDYHYWQAAWGRKPEVYIFPRWDFPARMRGHKILVRAYANTHRVGLWLNGKSLGVRSMPRNGYLDWHVPYAPGVLLARGYNHIRRLAQYELRTAGPAFGLQLNNEIARLRANGEDIAPIAVKIVDARGRLAARANNLIHFSVSGPAAIAGVCNGDPASHEANFARRRRAFHGRAMVLIRAENHPGTIIIRARASGMQTARLAIDSYGVRRVRRRH